MNEYSLTHQAQDYQRIDQAIDFLEKNFHNQPTLDDIAASVHLSPYHFQRLFKRWVGISPTQFMQFLTLEYAKNKLRESRSVLDAAVDAGLSGPGRLHDLFITFAAITPGEYKRQGAGLEIVYGFHDTPFGLCLLATTSRGICALYFASDEVLDDLSADWPQADLIEDGTRTQPLIDRIFAPSLADQTRPFHLLLKGTNFQVNVWRALLMIPAGAMVSYQDIARYLGKPTASRAVGHAVARNPISYLIPCHRVITKMGHTHRYRWGSTRKKAILAWEASHQVESSG
ncbi:MAG: methylated-DNA--[protein]-cysteine S-methyltransferase [Anaerolineales bacterium]|nr:methylated-DNA--[protein]-cysteine S-methyltransferase [Anaerolineales bacterium]